MDKSTRKKFLGSAQQKLKKMIKMEGTLSGAFILVPNKKEPYFFFEAAKTDAAAMGKIKDCPASIADTSGLISGGVRYDASAKLLTFEIGKVGSVTPKVKKPAALQKQFKLIASGGLRVLKEASIRVGPSDKSDTPEPDEAAITGVEVSDEALAAFDAVLISEEDRAEILAHTEETIRSLTRMESLGLPDAGDSSLASMSALIQERRLEDVDATMMAAVERHLPLSTLRDTIHTLASKDTASSIWDEFTLATKLLRHAVPEERLHARMKPYLMVRLEEPGCSYSENAIAVEGHGFASYGNPLNHGFLQVYGLSDYTTIERGAPTGPGEERRHFLEHTITYTQLARLLGAAYKIGSGSLVSLTSFDTSDSSRIWTYTGYVKDCWTHIETVISTAGLTPVSTRRTEDEAAAERWKKDNMLGRLMGATGLYQTKRPVSEILDAATEVVDRPEEL